MEQISYTKRICQDTDRIDRFLSEKRVGTLGMSDKSGRPYALPVNYVYWQGSIYFHGMGSGKKNRLLAEQPEVCFTVFEEFGTVTDPVPAKCDTAYFSVVLFGKAELVEDVAEKTQVLSQILDKFTPNFFKVPLSAQFVGQYRSGFDNKAVAVYRIRPEELTAKENPVDPDNMM